MKNKNIFSNLFTLILMVVICFTSSNSFAQTKIDYAKMKDCCTMQDGKMMCVKDGKLMPMEKDMTMENGTICMTNGECIMNDGVKVQMKEGEYMDMSGKMGKSSMMNKSVNSSTDKMTNKQVKTGSSKMKDCCMMKDGKMMCMKDGKIMPMEKDMTMENGTICMTNGECIMNDGTKVYMKEGEYMDMSGKMGKSPMMNKSMKSSTAKKTGKTGKMDYSKMKDCCMMQDGKMMCVKDGKIMPMEKDMTMENGTICMKNGECIMNDGVKVQMKEGEYMDMSGKMGKSSMMNKSMKSSTTKKTNKKKMAIVYTCPMHPEVTSDKPGKCPKCGMDLVVKK